MNSSCQMFKRACNSSLKCLEFCPSGLLIDGITDFQYFSDQIHQIFGNNTEIIQLSPSLSFINVNISYKALFNDFKDTNFLFNYNVFSIFPKKSDIDQIINTIDEITTIHDFSESPYDDFQNDLYYLCFQSSPFSTDYHQIPNLRDVKVTSSFTSSVKHIFYGFNSYSDLIGAYTMMMKTRSNWPIYSLRSSFIDKLRQRMAERRDFVDETSKAAKSQNIIFTEKVKDDYPQFNPDKFLFYVSFIEPTVLQHQRIRNVDEMYKIKRIDDVQISCVYQESSKEVTIRTFLGFNNEFRCLHVYDYLNHLSKTKTNSFSNVILVNENKQINFKALYNLYYIEIPQNVGFDSSLFNSFNRIDKINGSSSSFYGFESFNELETAEKLLSKPSDDSMCIKDVKCVDPSEINERFDSNLAMNMKKSKLAFLIFRIKRGDVSKLKSYLKGNKLIEKEVNFKTSDDVNEQKKFVLVGFSDNEDRKKAFDSLNNSQYTKNYKIIYPESKYGRPNMPSISNEKENDEGKESSSQIADTENNDDVQQNEAISSVNNSEEEAKIAPQQQQNERNQAGSKGGKASKRNKGKKGNQRKSPQPSEASTSSTSNNEDNSNNNNNNNNNDSVDANASNDDLNASLSATSSTSSTITENASNVSTKNVTLSATSSTNSTSTDNANNNNNGASATPTTSSISASSSTGSTTSSQCGGKKNKKNKKGSESLPENKSSDSSTFNPDQNLIYFYFIEKEKARKISQGKEVKSLFGVKKCQDVQRYRQIPDSDSKDLFTFFGFNKYDDVTAGINIIKSKWLADGQVKIYESTKAYIKHQNPNDDDLEDIEELLAQSLDNTSNNSNVQDEKYSLSNVKVKTYKSFDSGSDLYYSFNQLSVPNEIQNDLKVQLTKIKALKSFQKDIVPHNSTYEPHAFYFLNFKDSTTDEVFKNVFKSRNIEFYDDESIENLSTLNFIQFDERLIPDSSIELFVHFIGLILGVYEIKRKVFYRDSIVTMVFYEDITEEYLLSLIKQYLHQENLLFDPTKYTLKNTIYFKQNVVLQNESDLKVILKELEKNGQKPVNVDEDKLLFFMPAINNVFIQKYTFISLENQQEKMKALNHLNEIIFKGKGSVLKYNPSVFYIKYDPANFTFKDGFPRCLDDIEGVVELQQNVLSIENSIELTYIGFNSFNLLNKASYLLYSFSKSHDGVDDNPNDINYENGDENELITENLTSF